MKNKFFIFSLFIISLFYIISPFNVEAYYIFDPSSHLVPTQYDDSISIFDKYGYDLPACTDDLYVYVTPKYGIENAVIYSFGDSDFSSSSYRITKLCSQGYSPSLDKIKQYFPYFLHLIYKNRLNGNEYDIYMVSAYIKVDGVNTAPMIYCGMNGCYKNNTQLLSAVDLVDVYENMGTLIISAVPDNLLLSGQTYANTKISDTNYNYYYFKKDIGYGTTTVKSASEKINNRWVYPLLNFNAFLSNDVNLNPFFQTTMITNFDLYASDNDNVIVNGTNGPYYGTDVDLTIPKDYYALLVPRRNIGFYSHIWTDSNFIYSLADYDSNDYSNVSSAGLDEISFAALNGYNWARWDFNFTTEDVNNHRVLQIFNHGDSDLHLKLLSDDYYYYVLSSNSEGVCVGDLCYRNNYNSLKEISSYHVINNVYDLDEVNNNINYLNSIKNFIPSFTNAFVFVGTCVSSIFSLLNTEMSAYFYILFGLMIVMLIISIMK